VCVPHCVVCVFVRGWCAWVGVNLSLISQASLKEIVIDNVLPFPIIGML
jgi:hypothetical protein